MSVQLATKLSQEHNVTLVWLRCIACLKKNFRWKRTRQQGHLNKQNLVVKALARKQLKDWRATSSYSAILFTEDNGSVLTTMTRTFSISKKSVIAWERRLADLKLTLMLYSVMHEFIHQEI
ncbi:MAG: hypothetical protein AAF572_25080 [Cyanobacteria bacterium P01_B01_bin.77]